MSGARRILVTDAETRAVTAAVRALSRAGFSVSAIAASTTLPAPAHWSRSVAERLVAPHPLEDEAGFLDAIEATVARGGYSMLLPGSDASLLAVSRHRERLEPYVRLGLPSHEVVERSLDKRALLESAERSGLPSPETIACSGAEEAFVAARALGFPAVIKPVRSIFDVDGVPRRSGSLLVPGERELERVLHDYGDPCLLQRRERGTVLSYAGVYVGGELLGEAVSRYLRTWYPESGNASLSETIEPRPELRERVCSLLSAMGWEGLFELELIDRANGTYAAIDLNPRLYGSLALAVGAGASLPALWCEHVLGGKPQAMRARAGVFYRWEDGDFRHLLWQLRRGRFAAAAEVLMPRRRVVHPHFELADPGPLAARTLFLAKGTRTLRRTGPAPQTITAPDVRDPERAQPAHPGGRRGHAPERVAIIGAGPYGLSVSAHLRAAGIKTISFGQPLEFWRHQMPEGMVLRSRKRATHIADPHRELTIDRFELSEGRSVHAPSLLLEEFIDYGLWYQRQAAPDLDERKVRAVGCEDRRFRLSLEDGEEVEASRVVVAAGLSPFAHRPEPFAALPSSLVSHTSEHPSLAVFEGRRVLVVGTGQSALESAALLKERGADVVEVLARAPIIHWLPDDSNDTSSQGRRHVRFPLPPTGVGGRVTGWIAAAPDVFRRMPTSLQPTISYRCIRPAGSGWLRSRLEGVPISFERFATVAASSNGGIRIGLDDGSERSVDHVLLGTGYTIDVSRYSFLSRALLEQLDLEAGYPILGAGLESSVPGLHFLGAPAALSFGPIMRFVVGTWYASPALTRRVLGRLQPLIRFAF